MIETLLELDRSLFLAINSWHIDSLNSLMLILSGQAIWMPFILFIGYLAYKDFDRRNFGFFVLFLLLALIVTDVTSSYILKNIFNRFRPCRVDDLKPLIYRFGQKCGGKFGFVSSHAGNSFAIVTFAIMTLKNKKNWFLVLWILPVFVSYSRVYLGVHYPGDIIGGAIVGISWALILASLFKSRSKSA